MLLTKFCKAPTPSAYDVLQNEIGYFDAPTRRDTAPVAATPTKTLVYNNIPQTSEVLVARLHKDLARVDGMTDAFGQEIVRNSIEKLSAFLKSNNIAF